MAGNKNIPRLTEALAPEVFEFYVRHQEEIDKNIQHFFADQPDRYDEYLEYDSGKDRPLIGNPIAVNFSSFTYRPPTLADNQLQVIAEKYNRNRPVEVGEFLLEEKKVTGKKNQQKVLFKSNSMKHLLSEIKSALQSGGKISPSAEYQVGEEGGKEPRLLTEPPPDRLSPNAAATQSVSFRTTFHQNMIEAAKDWRISTNPVKFSWKKKSMDTSQSAALLRETATKLGETNHSERPFENRKSHSFLNITPSNYAPKINFSRMERSVGNPVDSKIKSSRLESEHSGTQLIEDSFKMPLRLPVGETPTSRDLPSLKMRLQKTNASEESELHPQTTTTKTSSHPRLLIGGKSLSHLRANINTYHGGPGGKTPTGFSLVSAGLPPAA